MDASQIAIGKYLTQRDPGSGLNVPLGVYSTGLNESYSNRSAFERELHAAVSSVHHFTAYLHGRNFTLYYNNQSLVHACQMIFTTHFI